MQSNIQDLTLIREVFNLDVWASLFGVKMHSIRDKKTGRLVKILETIIVVCPCGNEFKTDRNRMAIGRGKYCSKGCMYKYCKKKIGESHHFWQGNDATYSAIHKYIVKEYGQPMKCEKCDFESDNKYQIQWANVSGLYKRERDDWMRLCAKCHYDYDRHGAGGAKRAVDRKRVGAPLYNPHEEDHA